MNAKIKNEKVAMAFSIISDNETYQTTLGNAISLLAHIVDAGERINNKPKRIECNVGIGQVLQGYHIICEEILLKGGKNQWK